MNLKQLSHGAVASILIATFTFIAPLPEPQAVAQTPQTIAEVMAPYIAKVPTTITNNLKTSLSTYIAKANSGTPSQQSVNDLVSALTTYAGVLNDVGAITAGNKFLAANPTALRDYAVPASQLSTITAQAKTLGATVNQSVLAEQMNPTQAEREAAYANLMQIGLGGALNQVVKAVAGITQSQVKVAPTQGQLNAPHLALASYHPLPKLQLHPFETKPGPLGDCNFIKAFGFTAMAFGFSLIVLVCVVGYAMYCT